MTGQNSELRSQSLIQSRNCSDCDARTYCIDHCIDWRRVDIRAQSRSHAALDARGQRNGVRVSRGLFGAFPVVPLLRMVAFQTVEGRSGVFKQS